LIVGEKTKLDFASLFEDIKKGVLADQLRLMSDGFALLNAEVQHAPVLS